MKTNKYQRRFYRDWVKVDGLISMYVAVKETDLHIFIDKAVDAEFIKERVLHYRWQIENYITRDNRFITSLKPVEVELNAPGIVKEMSIASKKAGVGPMAAVAGAIAYFLGRDLLKKGCKNVIIENGGDIFLKVARTCKVGIYAGRAKTWNNLSLKIKPRRTSLGICTSSGKLGHSLSFGVADAVIILAGNPCLADAVATAAANRVQSPRDLGKALDFARSIKGVSGVVAILKDKMASWGDVQFTK